jgi:rare lipoprotein A
MRAARVRPHCTSTAGATANCAATLRAIQGLAATGNQLMIPKSSLLVTAFLQVTLLGPTSAADSKSHDCGLASVYSTDSEDTASGIDTQRKDFTAAHRSLPFGTLVYVNNQENGRSAVVRITDRGPFIGGRIIDLSKAAARELRISGLTQVCLNIQSKIDQ